MPPRAGGAHRLAPFVLRAGTGPIPPSPPRGQYAVGFDVLFTLVAVFTWITFHLSAAPFSLSTAAISSLFLVYLIGLVVTPTAGYIITRVGLRAGISGAIVCAMAGALITLAPSLPIIILGLAMVFYRHLHRANRRAEPSARGRARRGARDRCRSLPHCLLRRSTAAGVVPGAFWALGKWPACVAFIVRHAGCGAGHRAGGLAQAQRRRERRPRARGRPSPWRRRRLMNPNGGEENLSMQQAKN